MTQTYTLPPPATSATFRWLRRALLAGWLLFTLGAFAFVALIGTNAPYADEWEFVPALLGEEPALPWLWQQHNEHRMPLPRAVVFAYFKLTHDFRAGMVLQVAMLSALALFLMRLADQLRGRPHWADAFFPVSLLHIGHWENLLMGYQVCFVLFAVLATSLVVVALRITPANAFRSGVIAGVLVMLLALTGGSGLLVAAPVSAWLAFVALTLWRSGAKGRALVLLLLAALPLAYLGMYLRDYHRPEHHPAPCSDPVAVISVAGEVLGMSFGIGLSLVWWAVFAGLLAVAILTLALLLRLRTEPIDGLPIAGLIAIAAGVAGVGLAFGFVERAGWWAVFAGLLVVGTITLVLLVRIWKEPHERLSVAGLIAVTAGVTGVALAIGVGRGGWGATMGLWPRYALLSWPLLATAYLVWVKSGRKWVPILVCVAAAVAFPGNTGAGMMNGAWIASDYAGLAAQAQSGLTAEQIANAEPFTKSHHAGQTDRAIRAIPLLRRDRIGIFAR